MLFGAGAPVAWAATGSTAADVMRPSANVNERIEAVFMKVVVWDRKGTERKIEPAHASPVLSARRLRYPLGRHRHLHHRA